MLSHSSDSNILDLCDCHVETTADVEAIKWTENESSVGIKVENESAFAPSATCNCVVVNTNSPSCETKEDSSVSKVNENAEKAKRYKCSNCGLMFSSKFSLVRHFNKKHPSSAIDFGAGEGNCVCQHCGFRCHRIRSLRDHLAKVHDVLFNCETVSFKSQTAFEQWKDKVEEDHACSFTKRTGLKNNIQYYQCNRGGFYSPSGSGKRQTKKKGTCKIQQNCTSTIKTKHRKDGSVAVDICYTHHGHSQQLEHIRLPRGRRQQLAAILKQGIRGEEILNDIKENARNQYSGELKRYHLTKRKDLANIKRSFGIKSAQ